ncbi:MAG: response regulator [Bacteroidota bacterium]
MIKAVVIDDEQNSRELLVHILTDYIENVEVVGEAGEVFSAIQLIEHVKPDLIFLDIEMPGGNGFEILNAFDPKTFAVIVVTGYNRYSNQYPQFHFLFKPIDLTELGDMIRVVMTKHKLPPDQ